MKAYWCAKHVILFFLVHFIIQHLVNWQQNWSNAGTFITFAYYDLCHYLTQTFVLVEADDSTICEKRYTCTIVTVHKKRLVYGFIIYNYSMHYQLAKHTWATILCNMHSSLPSMLTTSSLFWCCLCEMHSPWCQQRQWWDNSDHAQPESGTAWVGWR